MSQLVGIVAWDEESGASIFEPVCVDRDARGHDDLSCRNCLSNKTIVIILIDGRIDPCVYTG